MLLRSANWDFARAQRVLTVYKQAIINGAPSGNPPPQPWLFSYLYPSDCLKGRFVLPTVPVAAAGVPLTTTPTQVAWVPPVPTGIPFVIATDLDPNNNPIKTILTNLPNAQLIYTRDLSQLPDQWDGLFLNAATALLSAYFINALARNAAQYNQAVAYAKSMLDQARIANGNEGIGSVDHIPDWLRARAASGINWGWNQGPVGAGYGGMGGWEQCSFPDGLRY